MELKQARVLAGDTTQGACSVALGGLADTPIEIIEPMARGHAEALLPMVDAVLAQAGIGFDALDALAVTIGPGSFTGTRIGLSAFRGMALALAIPLIGVSTLAALAQPIVTQPLLASELDDPHPVLVAIDARRDTYYTQMFGADGAQLTPPEALSLDALSARIGASDSPKWRVVGTGAEAVSARLPNCVASTAPPFPLASAVLQLARATQIDKNAPPPEPFYLRPPDATLPDGRKALKKTAH